MFHETSNPSLFKLLNPNRDYVMEQANIPIWGTRMVGIQILVLLLLILVPENLFTSVMLCSFPSFIFILGMGLVFGFEKITGGGLFSNGFSLSLSAFYLALINAFCVWGTESFSWDVHFFGNLNDEKLMNLSPSWSYFPL